jgi:hypothetical protein
MSVVVIDSREWHKLNQKLNTLEQLMHLVLKQQQEVILPKEDGYISIEDAIKKYNTSRVTISKKAKKYNISRMPCAGKKLLKEDELIIALSKKEEKPTFFKKQVA